MFTSRSSSLNDQLGQQLRFTGLQRQSADEVVPFSKCCQLEFVACPTAHLALEDHLARLIDDVDLDPVILVIAQIEGRWTIRRVRENDVRFAQCGPALIALRRTTASR